jgi:acetylornithine deacetylase/succinyl-diaminopimelate desuccinylase-like protein
MAGVNVAETAAHDSHIVEELFSLLRIPSISTDAERADDVAAAVAWVMEYLEAAGGEVERLNWHGKPLGVARLPASSPAGTTVLLYGHVDVQPPGRDDAWTSPAFVPCVRDGWIYGRGSADNKGPFYAMLRAATELARCSELPVDVVVLCDAEEEVGGRTAVDYLRHERPPADVCLILDTSLPGPLLPSITSATRGVASYHLRLRTNRCDLHSGSYGGGAMNAANVLVRALAAVVPSDGELPPALTEGVVSPSADERRHWPAVDGAAELEAVGARPADDAAAAELQLRTWARPAVDIHGLRAGETTVERNVVLAEAEAILSIRIAPGQDVAAVGGQLCSLIAEALPLGAQLIVEPRSQTPPAGPFSLDTPALATAIAVLSGVFGTQPQLVRAGGSLPILVALQEIGIEPVVSGLDVPEGNVHAPDERLLVEHLYLGIELVQRLLAAWGAKE